MITYSNENMDICPSEDFFNNSNDGEFKFMAYIPSYGLKQHVFLYCFKDLHEFMNEQKFASKWLPSITDKIVFEKVIYKGKEYNNMPTFDNVVRFASDRLYKEELRNEIEKDEDIERD